MEGIGPVYPEKLRAEQGLVRKVSFSCIVYKLKAHFALVMTWHLMSFYNLES